MADDFNPYREWLGWGEGRSPNYYELLGLAPFESDVRQVTLAAERAATKVRSFRPGPQARAWSQLLDEIRAAKDCLTDPDRKAAYDVSLVNDETSRPAERTTASASASSPGQSPPRSDFYPPGMGQPIASKPTMSATLQSQTELDPPRRAPPATTTDDLSSTVAVDKLLPPGAEENAGEAASPTLSAQAAVAPFAMHAAPRAGEFAATRILQTQRDLVLIGIGGIAVVIVGAVTFMLFSSQPRGGSKEEVVAEVPLASAAVAVAAHSSPQSAEGEIPTSKPELVPAASQPSPEPVPPDTASQPPIASASTPAPTLSAESQRSKVQALIRALETAKDALGEQNFNIADAELHRAELLADLPKHREAVARLKEVGGYVKQFRQAVAAAVAGMQPAETFKVGTSTQVLFVEGFADKVTLRAAGANKTYLFGEMPAGLAVAIADFKLAANDPRSRVVKGAYLLVHKRADSETHEKARSLWNDAQAAGANISHLMPFLSDSYSDFLKDVPE